MVFVSFKRGVFGMKRRNCDNKDGEYGYADHNRYHQAI